MPAKVNQETCIGCGACTDVCPTASITLNGDGKAEIAEDSCIDCGACVGTCPNEAISQ